MRRGSSHVAEIPAIFIADSAALNFLNSIATRSTPQLTGLAMEGYWPGCSKRSLCRLTHSKRCASTQSRRNSIASQRKRGTYASGLERSSTNRGSREGRGSRRSRAAESTPCKR